MWAFIHDLIAHPLCALTLYSAWAVKFHDWTSLKAWDRKSKLEDEEAPAVEVRKCAHSGCSRNIAVPRIFCTRHWNRIHVSLQNKVMEAVLERDASKISSAVAEASGSLKRACVRPSIARSEESEVKTCWKCGCEMRPDPDTEIEDPPTCSSCA